MKNFLLLAFGLFTFQALAAPYVIDGFTGSDVGVPDDYIAAEFGGELRISQTGTVSPGSFYLRQKSEDPFDASVTSYQLYEGLPGPMKSDLTPLSTPEGVNYSDLVTAKFYKARGENPDNDVEKVYFDGNYVYAQGSSSLIAYINSAMVELRSNDTAAAPVEEVPAADAYALVEEEECDENDPDCEYVECDENDPNCEYEDEYEYDVAGDVTETVATADTRDYSAQDAVSDVKDRFGMGDEIRWWSAWALVAVAAGTAVTGVLQQMKYNEASDAFSGTEDLIKQHKDEIAASCAGNAQCITAMEWNYNKPGQPIYELKQRNKTNQETMDSYSMARNIWFGVTAASITGAIVLFVW
ncbi:MAG: hypothetical protein LBR60_00045 [Fibrobacter sp.]|nr:hypothetical protein [Fibrobacter sp.]